LCLIVTDFSSLKSAKQNVKSEPRWGYKTRAGGDGEGKFSRSLYEIHALMDKSVDLMNSCEMEGVVEFCNVRTN